MAGASGVELFCSSLEANASSLLLRSAAVGVLSAFGGFSSTVLSESMIELRTASGLENVKASDASDFGVSAGAASGVASGTASEVLLYVGASRIGTSKSGTCKRKELIANAAAAAIGTLFSSSCTTSFSVSSLPVTATVCDDSMSCIVAVRRSIGVGLDRLGMLQGVCRASAHIATQIITPHRLRTITMGRRLAPGNSAAEFLKAESSPPSENLQLPMLRNGKRNRPCVTGT